MTAITLPVLPLSRPWKPCAAEPAPSISTVCWLIGRTPVLPHGFRI